MHPNTPFEGLLRPPIEWISAISSFISAIILGLFYKNFLISNYTAFFLIFYLLFFTLIRLWQGYKIYIYKVNLNKKRKYFLIPSKLRNKNKLLLGKGFKWTVQHTQRIRDLDFIYNLEYKGSKPKKESGLALHGIGKNEDNIYIDLKDRASHLLVLGLPGVGKTRFAELIISQDIHRGDVVIVLDPKGDSDLLKRMYVEAKNAGRENDFLVFHLGFPNYSCRYNPVGNFTRVTEVANRISNQLPSSGEAAAFKEFGWQFINSIAMALVALGEKPDYNKIKFYITKMEVLLERYIKHWLVSLNENYKAWVKQYVKTRSTEKNEFSYLKGLIAYVDKHNLNGNQIYEDLEHACRYDREYFSKITAALGPLLKKLTTGKSAELLSPDYANIHDKRPLLDWLQVIRNKQIVYVGLDALTDPVVAAAVGNAMFSDLVSVAGRIYKFGVTEGFPKINKKSEPTRICLHSDEFNDIIGDEFIPLLNKARGAGFTVTAYTQTWSDVEARLKSSAKAGQVAGNLGATIMFRCKEAETVEMFLSQLPKVPIMRVAPSSSSSDTSHGEDGIYFRSMNEDVFSLNDMRLIEQNDILNLPKGEAFCFLGGDLYKLRMPLLQDNNKTQTDAKLLIEEIFNSRNI